MLELTYKGSLDVLVKTHNIAELLDDTDLGKIGQWARSGYQVDKSSRAEWERRFAISLKLAQQVKDAKTFPWPGSSNIKFPLLTIAALTFHSRAFPSLVPASGAVHCAPIGYNVPPEGIDRAARLSAHMSYQLQNPSSGWEAGTDRALLIVPIAGCAFKHTYYDPVSRERCSDLVLPQNLVVSYYTTNLESAPRVSEYYELTANEVYEQVATGLWREPKEGSRATSAAAPIIGPIEAARNKAQGTTPPGPEPSGLGVQPFIDQCCSIDLDGDGYAEPYVVTFGLNDGYVRRISARFFPSGIRYRTRPNGDKTVTTITPIRLYTKIPFIPSPDGGFYDLGFGTLIGPINESVDSLLNQLVDAGTMSITAGGFLGRGARFKRGNGTFGPYEWKQIDSTGDDLNKSLIPLPVREPSQTILALLTFLVQYAERIASANEVQSGSLPDWNMKAEVVKTLDENGARIYAAIFKRIWAALGLEFEALRDLNIYYPLNLDYKQDGKWFQIRQEDYSGDFGTYSICSSADPNVVTTSQAKEQADYVMSLAMAIPGFNKAEAVKRALRSRSVTEIDQLFPVNQVPEAPDAKLIVAQAQAAKMQADAGNDRITLHNAYIKLQLEAELTSAKIFELYAKAELEAHQADAVDSGQQIAALDAQVGLLKTHRDGVLKTLELLKDHILPPVQQGDSTNGNSSSIGPAGANPGAGAAVSLAARASAGVQRLASAGGNGAIPPVPSRAGPVDQGEME